MEDEIEMGGEVMSRSIKEQRPPDHLPAQDRRDLERWQSEGGAVQEAHSSPQAPQARRERAPTQPGPRTETDESGEQPGDVAWRVGGPQGSGVDTAATYFSSAGAMAGLEVFGHREDFSNLQGRHSYFDVRLSPDPCTTHRDTVDLLTTFEKEPLA